MSLFEGGRDAGIEFIRSLRLGEIDGLDLEGERSVNEDQPRPEALALQVDRQEQDRRVREIYHPRPKVVLADDQWISFSVNRNWIDPIAAYNRCLIDLFQLFYDLATLHYKGRLSPSELEYIQREILLEIVNEYEYISLNQSILETYRGRHYLLLDGPAQIGTKRDWARSRVYEVRKHNAALREWTRAKQVDFVAKKFGDALRAHTPEERRSRLVDLPNLIFIDTRNQLGRPEAWAGMAVNPLPGARAYFVCLREQDWTLRIKRGGVPDETLERLRPGDISYAVTRNLLRGPLPWWCLSEEILQAFQLGRKQPTNSLFMSVSA